MNPSGVLFLESLDLVELFCSNGMSVQDRSERQVNIKRTIMFSRQIKAQTIFM